MQTLSNNIEFYPYACPSRGFVICENIVNPFRVRDNLNNTDRNCLVYYVAFRHLIKCFKAT